MKFPFEVSFEEVQADLDQYVTAVFSGLESEFLTMPKGAGFIDYLVFEQGYEALKQATGGFRNFTPETVRNCVRTSPISLIVIRTLKKMLLATRGKVFTLQNLDKLVECTKLKEFKTKYISCGSLRMHGFSLIPRPGRTELKFVQLLE